MRMLILFFCGSLLGCSYQWIRADRSGPVDQISIGSFNDYTSHGGLGAYARRWVGQTIRARQKPQLSPNATYRLEGAIESFSAGVIGFDRNGQVSAEQIYVSVRIHLRSKRGIVWRSTPHRVRREYVRGATPFETVQSRNYAVRDGFKDALSRVMATYFLEPRLVKGKTI